MRIVCGTWGQLSLQHGGIREWLRGSHFPLTVKLTMLLSVRFLIKDAQEDITGERLKA